MSIPELVRVPRSLVRDPLHLLSLGLGVGLLPFAPGTWGSLVGLALAIGLAELPGPVYWPFTAAAFVLGIPLCGRTARALAAVDPGVIVWDEVVGMLVTVGLAAGIGSGSVTIEPIDWAGAFVLFRFFDIVKPWPIRALERRLKGGLGVMADDLVAGGLAGLTLLFLDLGRLAGLP